ncbi:MFS transporter [Streptomyces sp. ISL-36]|uniref:MFS transporter n=1 Tax=Streptomyces sp. ISL-36 TaxID=2819182 RepID=UPI001BEC0D88|nr:MFS transporter [Streptomyces sp. ISL-36]MBT2443192.1 MFS transporter [Streptomyces sp. ISL-36]
MPPRSPAPTAVGARPPATVRRPTATLAVTSAATAVTLMNYTAPMLTLPDMAASFATPASAQAWLLNGTPLGLAVLLLIAGSLADDHGRRRVFLLGTLALGLTTGLGAFATSTLTFTLARVAQGAASAAVLAGSLGLLAHAFPSGPDRIRATGVWGAFVSAGIALGPLLAGALSLIDWRLAYDVLAVAALMVAALGTRTLTESRAPRGGRPDVAGALALGLALAALLTALTLGRDGWLRVPVGLLLLGAAAFTAVFVAVERRSRTPMIDLALLRRPAFLAATSGALFTGLAVIGLFSCLPALLQRGMGMSPLGAAWMFVLWSGTAFLVALQARRLAGRLAAHHQLAVGFALSTAGVLGLLGALDGDGSWPRLLPGLFVSGAGSGLLNAALPRLAVDSVPPERAAMGSGANNTARYIGSAAGVALTLALSPAGPDTALVVSAALGLAGAAVTLGAARVRSDHSDGTSFAHTISR